MSQITQYPQKEIGSVHNFDRWGANIIELDIIVYIYTSVPQLGVVSSTWKFDIQLPFFLRELQKRDTKQLNGFPKHAANTRDSEDPKN